jgi:hypothetical protein
MRHSSASNMHHASHNVLALTKSTSAFQPDACASTGRRCAVGYHCSGTFRTVKLPDKSMSIPMEWAAEATGSRSRRVDVHFDPPHLRSLDLHPRNHASASMDPERRSQRTRSPEVDGNAPASMSCSTRFALRVGIHGVYRSTHLARHRDLRSTFAREGWVGITLPRRCRTPKRRRAAYEPPFRRNSRAVGNTPRATHAHRHTTRTRRGFRSSPSSSSSNAPPRCSPPSRARRLRTHVGLHQQLQT